jgi:tRNA methyltransferase complex GCD14 subunit
MLQVMKTCDKLRECGFHSIRMMEVRQRPYDGRRHPFETVDLGIGEGIRPAEVDTSASALTGSKDGTNGSNSGSEEDVTSGCAVKRKAEADIGTTDAVDGTLSKKNKVELSDPGSSSSSKEPGNEIVSAVSAEADAETDEERIAREEEELKRAVYLKRLAGKYVLPTMPVKEVLIGRPLSTMKGHTAFLTFAVRPPLVAIDDPK